MNEWSSGCRVLLHFQRRRAETVAEYFALPVDVCFIVRETSMNAAAPADCCVSTTAQLVMYTH